ncbi:MAG: mono/diheme cytochrome c family protein [Candidatus Binatia bacterium]|jgi:mono/diheme cytochrome c family protein
MIRPTGLAALASRQLAVLGCLVFASAALSAQDVQFNRDIRPILSDRCFQCHGPDAPERKAKLRLDRADGPEGAHRIRKETAAIKPGSPEESALWHRITSDDAEEVMPPPGSHKKELTAHEQELFRRWIQAGGKYQDFWAFVPPSKPEAPQVKNDRWSQRALDRFVLRKLETKGMTPSQTADRRAVIRRVTLDLTGLPPTREEIRAFLADESDLAYERMVDRLLASPRYGEHMTKYWLDLVRFSDTNGIHHDHYRELTPYRDWVMRAFNANLPYDDFVKYQLAGDLYPEPTRDQLIASGFNRLHLIIDVGTALPEESYTRNVIDRVTSVGTAFMGLTVQCAVCHDHKYDPIKSKDFYQLFAFFNNLDAKPETGGRSGTDFKRGLQPPYINLTTAAQEARIKELDKRVSEADKRAKLSKHDLTKSTDATRKKTLTAQVKQAEKDLKAVKAERDAFMMGIPGAMVMKEKAEKRPAYMLIRGAYDNRGEQVERGAPAFLPPLPKKDGDRTRMDLARWFVSPENPLTARVAVNRFWQQFFGVGIVKTSEDFGAQGEWPSHPDLLDFLTVSFVESGWDTKSLMKRIVMSETYKQDSRATPEQFVRDPENRLLARGSRFRMDSEMIRDQALATSGLLSAALYGKSVKPPQPKGLWKSVGMPSSYPSVYVQDTGEKIYRRSVYTFWKRGMPPPQMTILNAPSREECIARRERTNTPLQALLLMNEQEYLKAARRLAHRTLTDRSLDSAARLNAIYETITTQLPDAKESKTLLTAVKDLEAVYRESPALAAQLCEGAPPPPGSTQADLAAWTLLVSSIYNLDIVKTRQ